MYLHIVNELYSSIFPANKHSICFFRKSCHLTWEISGLLVHIFILLEKIAADTVIVLKLECLLLHISWHCSYSNNIKPLKKLSF